MGHRLCFLSVSEFSSSLAILEMPATKSSFFSELFLSCQSTYKGALEKLAWQVLHCNPSCNFLHVFGVSLRSAERAETRKSGQFTTAFMTPTSNDSPSRRRTAEGERKKRGASPKFHRTRSPTGDARSMMSLMVILGRNSRVNFPSRMIQ